AAGHYSLLRPLQSPLRLILPKKGIEPTGTAPQMLLEAQCPMEQIACLQTETQALQVGLFISFLTGEALVWGSPLLEQDHPILASWDTFLRVFEWEEQSLKDMLKEQLGRERGRAQNQ
uniref:DUF4939 domain-containing protein n=1 Tax=Chelydra serpentina TaxID=8475 RepID=A0A8C3SGZ2_CHESE